MKEQLIRTREDAGVISRPYPIDHLFISATTDATTELLLEVPNAGFLVRQLVVTARGAGADLSLYSVPQGETLGNLHFEIWQRTISPNTTVDLTDKIQGFYAKGTQLRAYASSANQLTLHGWGEDYQ